MRLAREMHRPLHELGEQMTAEEFGLWQAFITEEPLNPGQTAGVAEVLLALHQGLIARKGGRGWSLSDFLPKRWRKSEAPTAPTADSLRAFIGRKG